MSDFSQIALAVAWLYLVVMWGLLPALNCYEAEGEGKSFLRSVAEVHAGALIICVLVAGGLATAGSVLLLLRSLGG